MSRSPDHVTIMTSFNRSLAASTSCYLRLQERSPLESFTWRGHLIEELCWVSIGNSAHPWDKHKFGALYSQKWRAASWSWASTNVRTFPFSMEHTECLRCRLVFRVYKYLQYLKCDSGGIKEVGILRLNTRVFVPYKLHIYS